MNKAQQYANAKNPQSTSEAKSLLRGYYKKKMKPISTKQHTEKSIKFLEDQDFYELMQQYRHTPLDQQKEVSIAFEAVKSHVQGKFAKALSERDEVIIALLEEEKNNPEFTCMNCTESNIALDNVIKKIRG